MQRLTTILLLILLTVIVILAEGCAIGRAGVVDCSKEEVKNLYAAREVAHNYLKIWQMQSGFIHGLMEHRQGEFPEHVVDAINELDDLSAKLLAGDPNEIIDYDLGLSLGLRVRLIGAVVEESVKAYSPDLLDVIPLLF